MRDNLPGNLLALAVLFAPLSLLSFGGSNSVIADIAHQSVAVKHWTSDREFADLFALSRAAPGPGSMLCALIGWKIAGLSGALAATVAFYLPASLLLFVAAKIWGRWRGSAWHHAVERGMAPIAAGLFLSGGVAVLRVAPAGIAAWIAAGVATAALLYWPKLHPVPLLLAAGAVFGIIDFL
jgi:chromate transporter